MALDYEVASRYPEFLAKGVANQDSQEYEYSLPLISAQKQSPTMKPDYREGLAEEKPSPFARIPSPQLTYDALLEQMAKLAYEDYVPSAQENPKYEVVRQFGYRPQRTTYGRLGMQLQVFLPSKPEYPYPVVAFRGTQGGEFKVLEGQMDWFTDADPRGVGYGQFHENKDLIRTHLDYAQQKGKVWLCGHSLGGALAQWTACTWPQSVGHVATFQAPGIPKEMVAKIEAYNKGKSPGEQITSDHYRMNLDFVPHAGQAFTPGEVHRFKFPNQRAKAPVYVKLGPRTIEFDIGPFLDNLADEAAKAVWRKLVGTELTDELTIGALMTAFTGQTHLTPILSTAIESSPDKPFTPEQKAIANKGLTGDNPVQYVNTYSTDVENNDPERVIAEQLRQMAGQYIERFKEGVKSGRYKAISGWEAAGDFAGDIVTLPLELIGELFGEGVIFRETRNNAKQATAYILGSAALSVEEYDKAYRQVEAWVKQAKSLQEALKLGSRIEQMAISREIKDNLKRRIEQIWYSWHPGQ
ncbi:hypothetical protein Mterra_03645 [Calidithermus terrae]|uniref:Lipase (Class 3) n=1 Tax=Calidithermus terrae TaxID=1408545 RepID=A0A399E7L7_9DEIN|nr:DUF2974 domain-containing protein [Calidithermus terrae]RIH78770.1 hypothetical protein Mterra_03645 [Calidithermus terrae]